MIIKTVTLYNLEIYRGKIKICCNYINSQYM